jgi:hypothetical protein
LSFTGDPEDVRVGWDERRGAELETLARLDLKPGVLDRALGVSGHVASTRRPSDDIGRVGAARAVTNAL